MENKMKTLADQVIENIANTPPPLVLQKIEIERWFAKLKSDITSAASVATYRQDFYTKEINLSTTTDIAACVIRREINDFFELEINVDSEDLPYISHPNPIPFDRTWWQILLGIKVVDPNRIYGSPSGLKKLLAHRTSFHKCISDSIHLHDEYFKFVKWIDDNGCSCDFKTYIYSDEYTLKISVSIKEESK
jgi:hypothetical protein